MIRTALKGVVFTHCVLTGYRTAQRHALKLSILAMFTDRFLLSDPRDKVYALLDLVPDGDIPITPDYSLPICQGYAQFAPADVRLTSRLNVPFMAGTKLAQSNPSLELFSWIPHLSLNTFTGPHT